LVGLLGSVWEVVQQLVQQLRLVQLSLRLVQLSLRLVQLLRLVSLLLLSLSWRLMLSVWLADLRFLMRLISPVL
jgi:hypothetical protein